MRRPRPARLSATVGGGYVLTVSSLASSALGFVFWVIAAARFSAADVGLAAAAVAAIAVISGVGVLGLNSAFLRYVPRAADAWRGVVGRGYGASALATGVLAAGALIIASRGHGSVTAAIDGRSAAVFLVAAVVWTIFSLQDFVLVAIRRPAVVLVENVAVALVRMPLLFLPLGWHGELLILLAWLLPTVAATVVVNGMLLTTTTLPAASSDPRPLGVGLARYCATATVGSAATVAVLSLMPALVAAFEGAEANARFFLPWTMASSLQVVAASMAAPLAAEIARGLGARERAETRRVLVHALRTVAVLGVLVLVAAPVALGLLGDAYRVDRPLLVLILGGAIANAGAAVLLARARARGHIGRATGVQWIGAVGLVGGAVLLVPAVGLIGAGWAAFGAQGAMAVAAVVMDRADPPEALPGPAAETTADGAGQAAAPGLPPLDAAR